MVPVGLRAVSELTSRPVNLTENARTAVLPERTVQLARRRQIVKLHYIRPEWHDPAFSGQRYSDFDTYAAVRH